MRRQPARVALILMAILSTTALILGRLVEPTPPTRTRVEVRYANLNNYLSRDYDAGNLDYLDLQTGETRRLALPADDRLDQASWSPWRDEQGRSQVVGRWSKRSGLGADRINREFGLARISFPDGRLLDTLSWDIHPSSPPRWFPDTSSRILFTASNGGLYSFDFDHDGAGGADPGAEPTAPRPLAWKCEPPGGGRVYLTDPTWPYDRSGRLGGRAFVSLIHPDRSASGARMSAPELWWLRLDPGGRSIEAAGRCIRDAPSGLATHERFPEVGMTDHDQPIIAYLAHEMGSSIRRLVVAPLDWTDGDVSIRTSAAHVLATDCVASPPMISPDARWVSYSRADPDGTIRSRMLAIPPTLGDSLIARNPTDHPL